MSEAKDTKSVLALLREHECKLRYAANLPEVKDTRVSTTFKLFANEASLICKQLESIAADARTNEPEI